MNKFCISTLTHDAEKRDIYLQYTVDTLLESVDNSSITWYIHCNGFNQKIIDTVDQLKIKYKDRIEFIFTYSHQNNGVGVGINHVNKLTENYEYVLFIEGDWMSMPPEMSGHKDWINSSIKYLDEHQEIDQILYRRYLNEIDHRQYGYGHWIRPDRVKGTIKTDNTFIELIGKEYTNNPHMRRNRRFYDVGIFPLEEFYDDRGNPTEIKGHSQWGMAEISAEKKGTLLNSSYMFPGNMLHCDGWQWGNNWEDASKHFADCGIYEGYGISKCKYGFLFKSERFCKFCDHTKDFKDLDNHNQTFERSLRE